MQPPGSCLGPDGNEPAWDMSSSDLAFQLAGGPAGAGLLYKFALTVSKGARQSTVETWLLVEKGAPPIVSVQVRFRFGINAIICLAKVVPACPQVLPLRRLHVGPHTWDVLIYMGHLHGLYMDI